MTDSNSSFSQALPRLQLAIDSTSLGAFKKCPRYYQLAIVEGWEASEQSVHLTFGILLHQGREWFEQAKSAGAGHDEALEAALQKLLSATWVAGRPWNSGDGVKNRFTLVRTLVWYLDHYRNDPLQTLQLASGRPAIELSFRFPSGYRSRSTGEEFLLCGHLDKIGEMQGEQWVSDLKSTKFSLDRWYFDGFSPDNQFTLYILAGQVAFGFRTRGLLLDAAQVLASGGRFARVPILRSRGEIDEWHRGLGWWLEQVDSCAEAGFWPMNDKACFRCDFRSVCSKQPSGREAELQAKFKRRTWDPLVARGEEG